MSFYSTAVPNLFGTRADFVEDNFFTDWGVGIVLILLACLLLTSNCVAWFLTAHRPVPGTPAIAYTCL